MGGAKYEDEENEEYEEDEVGEEDENNNNMQKMDNNFAYKPKQVKNDHFDEAYEFDEKDGDNNGEEKTTAKNIPESFKNQRNNSNYIS